VVDIRNVVPGGILPSDHLHVKTNDRTCSRCRREIDDEAVPLMLWIEPGDDMFIFCPSCCGWDDDDDG
jgi:hypothetical protein